MVDDGMEEGKKLQPVLRVVFKVERNHLQISRARAVKVFFYNWEPV